MLGELKTTFEAYNSIAERADTLVEERERRGQRHELEDAIVGMFTEIDTLVQNASMLPRSETPADSEAEAQAQTEDFSKLQDELRVLRDDNEALVDSNRALTQDADSLSEANRALQGEVSGLNADKQALADEVAELRDQLRISEGE